VTSINLTFFQLSPAQSAAKGVITHATDRAVGATSFFPSSSATKKRIGKDVTQHLVMMKRSYRGLSAGAMLLRRSNLFCTGAHFDHRRQSTAGFSVQRDRNRVETD